MGVYLILTGDSEPDEEFPYRFPNGPKFLPDYIRGDANSLLEHAFSVDLAPLEKIAVYPDDDESEEGAEAEDMSPEEMERWVEQNNEAAWQSPDTLATCVGQLVAAIDRQPSKLGDLTRDYPELFSDLYCNDGGFRDDLIALQRMVEWYRDHGVSRVRLSVV